MSVLGVLELFVLFIQKGGEDGEEGEEEEEEEGPIPYTDGIQTSLGIHTTTHGFW